MSCSLLIDSCSYFRLAQSIIPLLKTKYCEEGYCLCVINELDDEYKKNNRLSNKFSWASQSEYIENREKCFCLKSQIRSEIQTATFFIRETAQDEKFGVSRIDIIALSYCYTLKIPIVTDDSDMLLLAKEYEISSFTSLQLLKTLYDCNVIDIAKVKSIAAYWVYQNDTPKSYKIDFEKIFNEKAPL